jgi:hypothetical protein
VNGIDLAPQQTLTANGTAQFESVTFNLSTPNLDTLEEAHGGLSYAYAIVYPVPAPGAEPIYSIFQNTPAGSAIDPISAGTHTLSLAGGSNPISVDSGWSHFIILILHFDQATGREVVIGSTAIDLP